MYNQEILHQKTQKIYVHIGEDQIKEESVEWKEFQESEEPESIGYIFVETLDSRLKSMIEDQKKI